MRSHDQELPNRLWNQCTSHYPKERWSLADHLNLVLSVDGIGEFNAARNKGSLKLKIAL